MMPPTIDLARVTKILSPKQIHSIVRAQETPQIALWSGAVSSGKTIASLFAFLIALTVAPSHGLIVIMGKTKDTIERNLIEPLQSPLLFGPFAAFVHHTRGANTATILGRTVHLVGANDVRAEDRIRGLTIALAYVDEATLLPVGFWMMLLSRLRVPGAKLFATTNPDGPGHWLRKNFILKAADVGMRYWHFELADNPSLEAEYVARLKRQYVGLWFRRFIKGEWCLAEGAVYDAWNPDLHVVDILPTITRWIALGIDYGTTNPFAALLLGLGTDKRLYLAHEWRYDSKAAHRALTSAEYSQRLTGWLTGLTVHPEWTVVDPAAAEFVTQLHRDRLLTPTLANNSVLDGIRTVSSLIALDQFRVHRSCKGWIDEIGGYSWDPKKSEKGEDKPIKAEDHSLDAGRYAVHTTEAIWQGQLLEAAA